jgi:hypothetical protein
MSLQAFPGDFLLKLRPNLEPADSAAITSLRGVLRPIGSKAGCAQVGGKISNTKSPGGMIHPAAATSLTHSGPAGQQSHIRQREADGPPLRSKVSDMNIHAIWAANVTAVSARPIVDYSKQTLTPQREQSRKEQKLEDADSNTSASDILRITADIARGS